MSDYVVKTDAFEGPLEVLLSLIEKRKLFINDVSLSQVTDEFIDYVQSQERFPVSQASHFVFVATTLLLIKSKSLLPSLTLTEEEEGDIEQLEHRLVLYRRARHLQRFVRERYGAAPLFERTTPAPEPVFSPDSTMTSAGVYMAVHAVLANLPKKEQLRKASVTTRIALSDMVERLRTRLGSHLRMSFSEFTKEASARRPEVVVSFLALLELVKGGHVQARQERDFADITMHSSEIGVPSYE